MSSYGQQGQYQYGQQQAQQQVRPARAKEIQPPCLASTTT